MPRRRTKTDEILEELLKDTGPERPLRGHEIIRMVNAGRIPPGEYRYETEDMDGTVEIETFSADEDGRVKDLKIWVETRDQAKQKSKKRKGRARGPRAKGSAGSREGNDDRSGAE